ncbi:MAG: TonB-dependent receptor [Acidobacteria bacterium]|nr:TonB-dependent receptor [Acidobacteriota bacterium]
MTTRIFFLAGILFAAGSFVQARHSIISQQQSNGELRVEVKDPAGKELVAAGTLTNLATGVSRSFQTDAQGRFTLSGLSFGRYRLEVSQTGFAAQSVLVEVQSAVPVVRSVTLTLGGLAFNVDVIASTPLPGADLGADEIAAPVQAAPAADVRSSNALDVSDFLNRRLKAVNLNEIQGNPYQADLNYRGYTASPLLGTPQGLSVYLDGVRLNQPFGDVVSWDLIPRIAIAEVALIPGSNPLFGLNTLGGALVLQSKDGVNAPGTALEIGGGSFGRLTGELEHGGSNTSGLHWYTASSLFFEDGWRADSPSNVRQFFGKLGWQRDRTSLGLTVAYANNSLIGNGLQEQRFLDRDYRSIYTKPDITNNRAPFFNFNARHGFNSRLAISGNAYVRSIRTSTLNGDINEDSLDQQIYQLSNDDRAALAAAGFTGVPTNITAANTPFPFWRCIAQVLQRDEPSEKCNGLLNRTRNEQYNYGGSGQFTLVNYPNSQRNQLTAGLAFDRSTLDFTQSTQLGYLNPDRSVTGLNAFGDGVTGGVADGEPFDTRVDLNGRIQTFSLYATDSLAVGSKMTLSLSGRYNRTTVKNRDRINPASGPGGGRGSLDGDHAFDRFNPAVGLIWRPHRYLNAYVSYSEGNRAPTSVELGCADPETPCKLPNAMAGDPPLQQVVTRTFEAGLRSGQESRVNWSFGWFRAENRNDILFVASEQTGFGYFKNFGKTRRQGVEADLNTRIWRFGLGGGYTYLDATYQSEEEVNGESNSSSDAEAPGLEGLIEIEPGAKIPLIPQHMFKLFADLQATKKFSLNFGVLALSSAFARGNENNEHEPDGTYYLGEGRSPGYAVANFGARYELNRHVELFARVNNLFDNRYFTAAQLGSTGFTAEGNFIARPFPAVDGEYPVQHATFLAPGAPRAAWAGIRLKF